MSRNGPLKPEGTAAFAQLDWNEQGLPRSSAFDDVYFSATDGVAESRYVFLEGNDLPERWSALATSARFLVGETGFGTGLNFLNAWQLWNEVAPKSAHLEFLSVEAYPLSVDDLGRAHAAWPELAALSTQLQAQYPRCFHPGVHRLVLEPGRVTLTLLIGDARDSLEDCLNSAHPVHRHFSPGIDAWFLDGFAPARNPAMWRPELFACMQAMSAPAATVATFTAAGDVRRGLQAHGFEVTKQPGFGKKRDMTRAQVRDRLSLPALSEFPASPRAGNQPLAWEVGPLQDPEPPMQEPVVVLGAGLAGCHAARALADRGIRVLLIDQAPEPASGGSGNAQGVLYAKPAAQGGDASHFNLASLQFAERHYERWWQTAGIGQACGVLHLARDDRDAKRHSDLVQAWPRQSLFRLMDATEASRVAGVPLRKSGLWFPGSGWLAPPVLCRELLRHDNIMYRQASVASLQRTDRNWQMLDSDGEMIATAPRVILACALGLRELLKENALPVQAVRGQLSRTALKDDDRAHDLRIALCGDGYAAPSLNDQLNFGASFVPNDESLELRVAEHEQNLQRLHQQAPGLLRPDTDAEQCEGRASLRCATPDRLPMVGPVPDNAVMASRFALLGKNADASLAEPGAFLDGLYVSAGYGSRGLAYAPLATELLCWHLLGGAPPVSRALRRALHPARFLIRDIIRGKR